MGLAISTCELIRILGAAVMLGCYKVILAAFIVANSTLIDSILIQLFNYNKVILTQLSHIYYLFNK